MQANKQNMLNKFRPSSAIALVTAIALAVVGIVLTSSLLAATNTAFVEAENTTPVSTDQLNIISDLSASGSQALLFDAQSSSEGIIVSPEGNDTTGDGSLAAPFKTFAKAQSSVAAGGTIYARAGVYQEAIVITASGNANAPTTYASYPGEMAIIDGTGSNFNGEGIIYTKAVSNVTIKNFEVRNASGFGEGIKAEDSKNIIISGNKVHDIEHVGIDVSGDNIVVDNNEIYNACLTNLNGGYGDGGWPPALTTKQLTTGISSTNINITNNYVHDSWGEGIDAWFLNGGTIDSNRSIDNYSVNIYVDDSRDITITNNYVASTNDIHNRSDNNARPIGIAIASETNSQQPVNMIVNNNTDGGGLGDSMVHFTLGYGNITQSPQPQNF